MVHLLAEWSYTKSNLKLCGFRSQLQASYVSKHTEELWYNETVCLWMTIYICSCVCISRISWIKKYSLASLFNGISTFMCYLIPKPFFYNSGNTISPISGGVHIFPEGFCPKLTN